MSLKRLLLYACVLIPWLHARSAGAIEPIPQTFDETFTSSLPSSGYIFAGISAPDGGTPSPPFELQMHMPSALSAAGPRATACIEIESVDGRYAARAQYDLADNPQETAKLELPTHYGNELRQFGAEELAVRAWVAEDCGAISERRLYIPVFWTHVPNDGPIVLLVNAGLYKTRLEILTEAGTSLAFECDKMKSNLPLVTYDTRCLIPSSITLAGKEITIIRSRIGTEIDTKVQVGE